VGNICAYSRAERRYRCTSCRATFAATRGTPYFRLRTGAELVMVVALLCHGCPLQAVVAASALDERTVACWWERAGRHCEGLHAHLVQAGRVDLSHVQADEIWVKLAGRGWAGGARGVPGAGATPVATGPRRWGRPRLVQPAGLLLAQVVKHTRHRRLTEITRRVVIGSTGEVQRVPATTGTGTVINTAYIERLNATFRACMAYNYCWVHESLRARDPQGL